MKRSIFSVTMLVLLLGSGYTLAQTGAGYDLTWWTVDGGGGTAAAAAMPGRRHQPTDAAPALTSSSYALVGGFWATGGEATPAAPKVYLLPSPKGREGARTAVDAGG